MTKKPKETCALGPEGTQFCYHGSTKDNASAAFELVRQMRNEFSYIHEHLMTLHFISREFNCKTIVEVGTGMGHSTLALAMAAQENGGHLTTIDINQCIEAKELIEKANLSDYVTFLKVEPHKTIPWQGKIDFLWIDGDHSYEGVTNDIINYVNHNIKVGGWVAFHDTNNPKWGKDVNNAIATCSLIQYPHIMARPEFYQVYEWLNCNGLTVLKKVK